MSDQVGTERRTEVAVLAGGCFWGVEDILRDVPGVIDTEVGYTGGWLENPTYEDTHDSKSGHAEAVRVTFDPSVLGGLVAQVGDTVIDGSVRTRLEQLKTAF